MVATFGARAGVRCSVALAALGLLAAACSSGEELQRPADDELTTPTSEASASTADEDDGTTTTAAAADDADAAIAESGDEIEAIWVELWSASGKVEAEREAAYDALGDAIDPEVEATLTEMIAGEQERTVVNSPVLSAGEDGAVRIDDCLNVRPAFIEDNANWWSATAVPSGDGGWVIQDLALETAKGCVPAEIAEQALAAYHDFWDSRAEYWNPADPDHPDLERTVTGEELARITPLLTEHREKGWYVVIGVETRRPYVAVYENPAEVLVVDCQLVPPTVGLFDADGNRLEGIADPVPDQRDFNELVLVLEEGQWKVEHVFRVENADCEFDQFEIPVV